MSQVTVKVNGYAYTVGCEDGQELHLQAMAAQVDNRVESIKALGGNSGEVRLLLLASLLMADEIYDLRAELDGLRSTAARAARTGAEPQPDPELAQRLGTLANRAEEIAVTLQRS
jgi:cell division protein ZapA